MLLLLGLAFGSFANVVIWRFPRGESVSHPPSACPRCKQRIRWHDNIPVVSWVLLRGRCRDCAQPISPRYPGVEAVSGLLWLLAGAHWGMTLQAVFAIAMFYLLLILAFIDLDTMRLPNPLVAALAAIGLVGAMVSQLTTVDATPLTLPSGLIAGSPLLTALVGAVASAGVALLIALTYSVVRKQDGFGMGDVKLLAALGLYVGVYGVLVLFIGSIFGAAYGVWVGMRRREGLTAAFPFGPFLAIAAVIMSLFGPALWAWYVGLISPPL